MSNKRPIIPVEALDAVSPRTKVWRQMAVQLAAREESVPEASKTNLSLAEEHFQAVASQLREQPIFGHDFEHTNSFFHRFMRAASDRKYSADLQHILSRDSHVRPHQATLSPSLQAQLKRNSMGGVPAKGSALPRQQIEPSKTASAKKTASEANQKVATRPSFGAKIAPQKGAYSPKLGVRDKMLRDGGVWDLEPRYKLSRTRRRHRLWGDKFTLTRPYGREPFYFDHSTTFYPVELKPPPDVDYIPFELYAALGVLVGWQWMVDEFVRQDFVTDRTNDSAIEIFLANYRLLGVAPAVALQGAVAHYPSEEHMLRILQYLALRSRAKARMRVELLDHSGKTVAEVWAEYGILRRSAQVSEPTEPPHN